MKTLMKIAFLMLVLSIAAIGQKQKPTPTPAPPTCGLSLSQAPAWGPIKLGMTESEFQKVFPRMPFMVNRIDLPETPEFDNVDNMAFTFYKERLEELTVQLDLSKHWDNVAQFADDLSSTYKLPATWIYTLDTGMLECTGFRLRAVSSRNEIKIRDLAAAKNMQAENPPPAEPPMQTKTVGIPGMTRPTPRPSPHP